MSKLRLFLLLAPVLLLLPAAPAAAERPAMPETLDHKSIHEQYNDGNFEVVVKELEGFMARNRSYSLVDSVFIAKHLAVVYTADPATREKGKYYMHRLLEILPSAKLVDMYVSEEIDRIFDKVREEFQARQRGFTVDTARAVRTGRPAGPSGRAVPAGGTDGRPGPAEKPERSRTGFWIAGGVAVGIAGATAAYLIHQGESEPGPSHWDVPAAAGR